MRERRDLGQRLVNRRPVQPQFLELLCGVELLPEVERHSRGGGARTRPDPVDEAEQRSGEVLCPQPFDRGQLSVDNRVLQRGIRHDRVDERRHVHRILVIEEHTGAIHRRRDSRRCVRNHRHLFVERLYDRDAEPLVLAGAEKDIGDVVERHELFVRNVPDEMDMFGVECRHQLVQRGNVSLESALGADEEQPRARVEEGLIGVKEPNEIFDLLVRDHPSDEQHVGPLVVEPARDQRVRLPLQMREVGNHGQDGGAWEPERFEILPVEFGIAEREIAAIGIRLQLAPAAKTLTRQRAVDADEIVGRRDVVIDERHAIGQRECRARSLRAEGEMVKQQIVAAAAIDELAKIARLRLEPVIGGLDEDLGFIPGVAQHALDAQHLVADGVAIPQRRQHLVDADHARLRPCNECPELPEGWPAASFLDTAGPVGRRPSTCSAAGRSRR